MKSLLGLGVVTLATVAFGGATISSDGSELSISVPSGEETYSDAVPSTVTKITKNGAGSCVFNPSSISFTGTFIVQQGTIHGERGKFGTPASWKIVNGAALRFDDAKDYKAGEDKKPSGTLEIEGMGCDGYPAYYYTMKGTSSGGVGYTTSHGHFAGGVKLLGDTSVGGGRWGFGTLDMQGHDLYTFCTNGQAQYETYYGVKNAGNFRIKAGEVLLERASTINPLPNGQAYILSNNAKIRMYNFPFNTATCQASMMDVKLDDNATGTITCTGSPGTEMEAARNTWLGNWHLGKGKVLNIDVSSMFFCGTMKGSIDGGAELYKKGNGTYTITTDGTHAFKNLTVYSGQLNLGRNSDGSANMISNIWDVSGNDIGATYVARLNLGENFKLITKGTQKVSDNGIRVGYSPDSSNPRYGIVSIASGAVVSNEFSVGCDISNKANAVGAIYMDDATVFWRAGGSNDGFLGRNSKGYGYLCQNGGTFTHEGYMNMGATGRGCIDQRGGLHRITTSSPLKFARSGANSWACYHQTGGTFDGLTAWFNYNNVTNCVDAMAVLTTTGSGSLFKCNAMKSYMSRLNVNTIVNVNDGATLQGRLYREIEASGYSSSRWNEWAPAMTNTTHLYLNINGGILKNVLGASVNIWNADRMRAPSRVTVYEKGVTFDTTGTDMVLYAPLERPFGKGIKSIALPKNSVTNFNYYIASPRVKISSSTGTGASAFAVFNEKTRQVERIDITSPGCGYDDATILIENNTLGTAGATCELEDLVTTGAVRKVGTGTLTLQYDNTYGGVTRVEGGKIEFASANGIPQGSALEFSAAAISGGSKNVELLSAVNYNGGVIRVTEADTLDVSTFGNFRTVAKFTNALTAVPTLKLIASDGTELSTVDWKLVLSADGKTLKFGRNHGLIIMVK